MPQNALQVTGAKNSSNVQKQELVDASGVLVGSRGGLNSTLNVGAAAVIKATPGRVARLIVIAPGTTSGALTLNDAPTPLALSQALNYKGGAYHSLLALEDMKYCLASGYCFVDGIPVFESFETEAVAVSGEIPMPQPSERQLGGHCTLTIGYDDNHKNLDGSLGAARKRNSWGSTWGLAGDFWLPYEYVRQYANDAWILHLGKPWA